MITIDGCCNGKPHLVSMSFSLRSEGGGRITATELEVEMKHAKILLGKVLN